jgi:hypothetical protein
VLVLVLPMAWATYSGKHDFVQTEMLWPITHMIAPKSQAVACASCHTAEGGRLGGITGVYLPARDSHPRIDRLGWLAVAAALAGVLIHAAGRWWTSRRPPARH